MHFRRLLVTGAVAALVGAVGCGSSNSQHSQVTSDVILGPSSDPLDASPSFSGPLPTVKDAVPQVPSGAVMAATVVVDSGPFKGTSRILSTGTVGCSYSLFGDKQWRINFTSEGEFESKDTTSSGRRVILFGVTTQTGGTADLAVSYTDGTDGQDLEDKDADATVTDNGSSVTFKYIGRNGDGTLFHGAALCTKALRSQ